MNRPACLLLLILLPGAGCSDPLPCASGNPEAGYTLAGAGITVEVTRSPYRYLVKDATGAVVLSSAGAGKKDGYGTVGWTNGQLFWGNNVSPGYFTFDTNLEPWRDDWTVVAASQPNATSLEITLAQAGDPACIHQVYSLRASTLRVETRYDGKQAPRAWSVGFSTPPDEAFLGFGERYNQVDQRGLTLYSWAEEGGLGRAENVPKGPTNPWPSGETMTYYPVPFFLSSKGYGFWLDSTWRNEFNLASERADAWRVWDIGPTLAYEVYVPIPADTRPWPQQIVDLFTATTGRPMIPPDWSFGPRRRINRNAMVGGVLETQAMRTAGLALTSADDALHFLPAGSEIGNEADIAAWTQANQALGVRAIGYYNPYVSKDPSALDALAAQGLANNWFLRTADGSPSVVWLISGSFLNLYTYDVTNADAVGSFTSQFQHAFDLGYSGWMYDFGEYVQPDVVASNGMTGEQFHNLFPVLYDKAGHDALEAGPHKGDWYFFARSGYTGSSQYVPVVWSGDPDASFDDANGLPAMVRAGVNMGLSGVPHWGSDIGGYKCSGGGYASADGELLTRWIEFGALGSDMHDEDSCAAAPDTGMKATIWSSTDAQAAWKTYARLHTRLFPYLRSLADDAHATGAPTMRAMFFEHPEPEFASVDDTYYLGPALLVAPVVQRGARTRTVHFPAGHYLDFQAPPVLRTGPAQLEIDAPLDRLPLFLREGQLVPLLDPTIDTLAEENDPIIIGPADVATVYDVVGLLTPSAGHAAFALSDGGKLAATWSGAFQPPSSPQAVSEAELGTCAACWLMDSLPALLPDRVIRVRVSASGDVTAGGLALSAQSARRIRWDLYLVEP